MKENVSVWHPVTFKLMTFHLWQMNFPLMRSQLAVPYGAYYYYY